MATLYEIDQGILECIDLETGEIVDLEKLEQLQIERNQKIEGIALWYKNLMSDAEQYKAEKDYFAKKEKVAKNKAESLKKYLDSALSGMPYKTTRVDIKYRSSEALVVDDITQLDERFIKYGDPVADKDAIKRALKDGAEINGVHLETRNNINIK